MNKDWNILEPNKCIAKKSEPMCKIYIYSVPNLCSLSLKYYQGAMMPVPSPNRSTQLDSIPSQLESQVADSSNQVVKTVVVGKVEVEKEEAFNKRMGHTEEVLKGKQLPSCIEVWWSLLNSCSFCWAFISLDFLTAQQTPDIYKLIHHTLIVIRVPVIFCGLCFIFIHEKYFGMPSRLMGRVWRFVGDGIVLVSALILREAFPYVGSDYSIHALILLVDITLHIYSWLQVIHRAGDISFGDVLLAMIVQAAIYKSAGHNIVCICIVLFFCGVMCYKYISYSVPINVEDKNKDVELLPCPV